MNTQHTRSITSLILTVLLCTISFTVLQTEQARAQEDETTDMIIELFKGSDIDMRNLALQQIRESMPGEATTQRFIDILPTLTPDLQVQLVSALGDRGDIAARQAILEMFSHEQEAVRQAAVGAIVSMAKPEDSLVLARLAATGTDSDIKIARQSLRKLSGNEMNTAMIQALNTSDAKVKVELITALTDRLAKDAVPEIIKNADDPDLTVRLAVLDSLVAMSDDTHTALIVKRLKASKDRKETSRATQALMATCRRAQTKATDIVLAGLKDADAATSLVLMRALPEAGGPKALNEIVKRLKHDNKRISDEAVRVLTGWPDRAAIPYITPMAKDVNNQRNHILAIRGLVRLAGPAEDLSPDLDILTEVMGLATRNEEKTLVLGTLGTIPTLKSLALVSPCLKEPALMEAAALAAVLICENIETKDQAEVRTAMQQVIDTVQSQAIKDRAKNVLESQKQAN